ncbi:Serrate RNA effector molecule [Hibiscus syriacus]|uniref:Serrate RNA effector molecule n=1 Tax=Hibiscus syriacus TaxID=106335 RepID=A0A6A3CPL3_HIBSY|nr:Serrate RNA effector molecule [Hibiscus syriacus]
MPFYFSLSNDIASADWDAGLGGSGNTSSSRSTQREGLMSYKQFIQELEDDILPDEAERRYQEYKSEYISTQKQAFFDAHKDEEWLKDKYHPTNLVTVIERRNELARTVAKEFLLDLHSGTLDLSPGVNPLVSSKPGQASDPNSEDEADIGLESVELLDILITYLWRVHGLDYYGIIETSEAKGLRHVITEGKSSDVTNNESEWEKKLDSCWQERLRGQDPLELMTAKGKIDTASVEVLDPFVQKIRDEKFVHKHLKLKHPEFVTELTSKVREELYYQNYMKCTWGTPVMQQSLPKDKPPRQKMLENRLKDERGLRGVRDNRENGSDRYDRFENPQSSNFPSKNDGTDEGNRDDSMFDAFDGRGMHVRAPVYSDTAPPPVLMPVPCAGPLRPFVPAPLELAIQVFRERGDPPFEGNSRGRRPGPNALLGEKEHRLSFRFVSVIWFFPPTKPSCRSPDQTNQSRTAIESNGRDYRSHGRNKTRSKRATKIDEDT